MQDTISLSLQFLARKFPNENWRVFRTSSGVLNISLVRNPLHKFRVLKERVAEVVLEKIETAGGEYLYPVDENECFKRVLSSWEKMNCVQRLFYIFSLIGRRTHEPNIDFYESGFSLTEKGKALLETVATELIQQANNREKEITDVQ